MPPPQRQTARAEDEAKRLRAQLERALSALSIRASAQYETMMKRRTMASFKLALAARRAEAFAPGAGGASSSSSAAAADDGGGDAGGQGASEQPQAQAQEEQQGTALQGEVEARLSLQKENDELRAQLEAMGRELEERTEQLVAAKVAAAENDLRGAELSHEVKQLTTKLEVIDFAEIPPPPSSRATRRTTGYGGSIGGGMKRRNSFESRPTS